MVSDEKIFSICEVVKSTGLTVRTLQRYDNIDILPTSGCTESCRRYYTKKDNFKVGADCILQITWHFAE